jgi:tetratricopeptide (TPR) repeat protein
MNNIYVCFKTREERREFTRRLLNIGLAEPIETVKATKEMEETLEAALDSMERGKTKSLYYMMNRRFYYGIVPETDQQNKYDAAEVFKRGFRSIYYQNSYYLRPGYWLVVKPRSNFKGVSLREWVLENTSESQRDFNVPVSQESIIRWHLRKAKDTIRLYYEESHDKKASYLDYALKHLNIVYEAKKELFKNRNVYIWEKLAFYFYDKGLIDKAELCLRKQASLQPGVADAYLNLGVFLYEKGYIREALSAYAEGLIVNPNDQFIHYNISSLMAEKKNYAEVLDCINSLIDSHPNEFAFYKLKTFLFNIIHPDKKSQNHKMKKCGIVINLKDREKGESEELTLE